MYYLGVMDKDVADGKSLGLGAIGKFKYSDMVKGLTDDLNFLSVYFRVMQPHVELQKFAPFLKEGSAVTQDDLVKIAKACAMLPAVLLSCPGLLEVMAHHICGYQNDVLERVAAAKAKQEDDD